MKICGALGGQFGDHAMCVVLAKAIKRIWPHSHYTMMFPRFYAGAAPLYENNKYIDRVGYWDAEYEDWPTPKDAEFLKQEKFNLILPPFPNHPDPFWYLHRHQCQETCLMYGLPPFGEKEDLQIEFANRNQSNIDEKLITVALFGGFNNLTKSFSLENANKICKKLKDQGFKVIQIGTDKEPNIEGAERFFGSYVESVQKILSSKLFVTVDTGLNWIMSGYKKRVVGLYGFTYYPLATTSQNWQPVNPNAVYLESDHVNNIKMEDIFNAIDKQLKE